MVTCLGSHFYRATFETAIHDFVTSRHDYCNFFFAGLPYSSLCPLQLLQHFAARLLFHCGKFSHLTPLLGSDRHWLPIKLHHHFKILVFTYRILYRQSLAYLSSSLLCCNIHASFTLCPLLIFFFHVIFLLAWMIERFQSLSLNFRMNRPSTSTCLLVSILLKDTFKNTSILLLPLLPNKKESLSLPCSIPSLFPGLIFLVHIKEQAL